MKKIIFILAASTALLAGCTKDVKVIPARESVRVSVKIDLPEEIGDSKVTFSGKDLAWKGDETLGIWFGTTASDNTAKSYHVSPLSNNGSNWFEGDLTFTNPAGTEFAEDDMLLVTVPSGQGVYTVSSQIGRIVPLFSLAREQVQPEDGVMNGENFPLYLKITPEIRAAAKQGDSSYIFQGMQLKWASSVIRFNVYGTHPQMNPSEKLQSVSIVTNDADHKFNRYSSLFIDTEDWRITRNWSSLSVSLGTPVTIAGKNADNGAKLFLAIAAKNDASIDQITVTTDKAVYYKDLDTPISLNETGPGNVLQYGLNITNWKRVSSFTMYSTDGGATWKDWDEGGLPDSGTYTSLKVKHEVNQLSSAQLSEIREWTDSQANPVDLDLSGIDYSSTTFPAVFGNSTASKASQKLASIVLPANITTLASSCFRNVATLTSCTHVPATALATIGHYAFANCTSLTSFDLTGAVSLGQECFSGSGLTSINVPSTVTSLPLSSGSNHNAFMNCYNLTSIYWAAKVSGFSGNGQCFRISDSSRMTVHETDLTITIAGNTTPPTYLFNKNPNLVKVIFEESTSSVTVPRLFEHCMFLRDVEFRGGDPEKFPRATTANIYTWSSTYPLSSAEDKRIISFPDVTLEQVEQSTFSNSANTLYKKLIDNGFKPQEGGVVD